MGQSDQLAAPFGSWLPVCGGAEEADQLTLYPTGTRPLAGRLDRQGSHLSEQADRTIGDEHEQHSRSLQCRSRRCWAHPAARLPQSEDAKRHPYRQSACLTHASSSCPDRAAYRLGRSRFRSPVNSSRHTRNRRFAASGESMLACSPLSWSIRGSVYIETPSP